MKPTIEFTAYLPAVCNDRETTLQLLVRIASPALARNHRPELNLGLSIDRSGSMLGEPLAHALSAGAQLVRQLRSTDWMSVVAFDERVEVPSGVSEVGSGKQILQRLKRITARGATDLHRGWLESCLQVEGAQKLRRLSRVILLSDGQTNEGLVDPARIAAQVADWQRKGVSTTTVGLGLHYNEDLLSEMAKAGCGSFYHVEDSSQIESYLALELQGMFRTFGQGVSLSVEGLGGVELLRVFNPLEGTPTAGFSLSDLIHGCPLEVLLEFRVPKRDHGDVCRFRLEWNDLDSGERQHIEETLRLPVVPFGQLCEFGVHEEVRQKQVIQLTAKALQDSVRQLDARDPTGARTTIKVALQTLHKAGHSPEIQENIENLTKLLAKIDAGSLASVRKVATSSSSSMSLGNFGSVTLSGRGFREFLALPESERTPEKLQELMGWSPGQ